MTLFPFMALSPRMDTVETDPPTPGMLSRIGKTKQNQYTLPRCSPHTRLLPSNAQTCAQSQFSMRHLPRSVINTQSEPAVISPYRFYIEHNEAAITQKLASAIKSFLLDQSWSDVNCSCSFPNGKLRTVPGKPP